MLRVAIKQALVLLLLAGGAAVATHFFHPLAPAWYAVNEPPAEDEVTLQRVREEWAGEVMWLDARPTDQYEAGHIPGARLLNEQGFDNQLFELLDQLQTSDRPVVLYCGGESCQASRKIRQHLVETFPLENVWVLKGGWKAWQAAGGEIQVGGEP
ncbi:MAG: rhodanese-like domain-containing protein [Verrucomicrobiales bacterium]|nr:rhodanese-like domain-containing protein [Verrucomicrobiales bacterium]